jgi:hypothetical protein
MPPPIPPPNAEQRGRALPPRGGCERRRQAEGSARAYGRHAASAPRPRRSMLKRSLRGSGQHMGRRRKAWVFSPPGSDFRDFRGDVEPGADGASGAPRFDFRGALFRAHSGSRIFASSIESTRGSEARGRPCLLGCTSRLRGGGSGGGHRGIVSFPAPSRSLTRPKQRTQQLQKVVSFPRLSKTND